MTGRDLRQQAAVARDQLQLHLDAVAALESVGLLWSSPAARAIEERLERDIEGWEKVTSWGPLDVEAVREQGRALRSKELLEYFRGAQDAAEYHRAEAKRLSSLLETAEDQGRIQRA